MKIFNSISSKILVPVIVMTIILVTLIVWVSTRKFQAFADSVFAHNVKIIGNNLEQNAGMRRVIASDQVDDLSGREEMVKAIE